MATPYAVPADVLAEFGEAELIQLTDRGTPRTHAVDTVLVQRACDRASAEIDAALAARYAVPLSAIPDMLRYLAVDMAFFYLHGSGEPAKSVQSRYDTAQRKLRDIQAGAIKLGLDAAGAPVADESQDVPEFAVGDKNFSRGGW